MFCAHKPCMRVPSCCAVAGDHTPDLAALLAADVIIATPEKWDGISRNWQTRGYVKKVGLCWGLRLSQSAGFSMPLCSRAVCVVSLLHWTGCLELADQGICQEGGACAGVSGRSAMRR